MKICNSCGIEKPKTEYHKRGNGLKGDCKVCRSLEHKEHYYKDHEETKRKKRLVWQNNKQQYLKQKRESIFLQH